MNSFQIITAPKFNITFLHLIEFLIRMVKRYLFSHKCVTIIRKIPISFYLLINVKIKISLRNNHPFIITIFAVLYALLLKGTVIFCDCWNPYKYVASFMLAKPEDAVSASSGEIHYPSILTTIAESLIAEPSSTSSAEAKVPLNIDNLNHYEIFTQFKEVVIIHYQNDHPSFNYIAYMREKLTSSLWASTREDLGTEKAPIKGAITTYNSCLIKDILDNPIMIIFINILSQKFLFLLHHKISKGTRYLFSNKICLLITKANKFVTIIRKIPIYLIINHPYMIIKYFLNHFIKLKMKSGYIKKIYLLHFLEIILLPYDFIT